MAENAGFRVFFAPRRWCCVFVSEISHSICANPIFGGERSAPYSSSPRSGRRNVLVGGATERARSSGATIRNVLASEGAARSPHEGETEQQPAAASRALNAHAVIKRRAPYPELCRPGSCEAKLSMTVLPCVPCVDSLPVCRTKLGILTPPYAFSPPKGCSAAPVLRSRRP